MAGIVFASGCAAKIVSMDGLLKKLGWCKRFFERGVVPVQILDEKNPRQKAAWFV
jgi:hypothetical protein